jgi:pyruvate kinase
MKKIIITLGPSTINNSLNIKHQSNYIYRINGAHSDKESLRKITKILRNKIDNPKILIDLPGNKIRTSNLNKPIVLKAQKIFILKLENTNFPEFVKFIHEDLIVHADDGTLKFQVLNYNDNEITFCSYSDGLLKNGKGLHIRGIHSGIPFLFQKDLELIEMANELALDYVGLSFVRNNNDINQAKKLIDDKISIIPKVETLSAVKNINQILENNNHILIDRGDLSTDVGITKVPIFQNYIIQKARFYNTPVYLATQFLKNMEINPLPTIAEINDLYNTLKLGVSGIQLSEETAVGKYPQECLDIIGLIINEIFIENPIYYANKDLFK